MLGTGCPTWACAPSCADPSQRYKSGCLFQETLSSLTVRRRLAEHLVKDDAIEGKLENIIAAVRCVLQWSWELKERLRSPHETDIYSHVYISPETLFRNAWNVCSPPEHIHLYMEIDADIKDIYI